VTVAGGGLGGEGSEEEGGSGINGDRGGQGVNGGLNLYYGGSGGGDSGVQDDAGNVLVDAGGGGGASSQQGSYGGEGGVNGGAAGQPGNNADGDAGGGGSGGTGSAAQPGVQPAGQCVGGGAGSSSSDAGTGTSGLAGGGGVGGSGISNGGGGGGAGCGGGGGGGGEGGGGGGGSYGPSGSAFTSANNGGTGQNDNDGGNGSVTLTELFLSPAQSVAVAGSGSASDPITVSWVDPTQPVDPADVGYQVYVAAPGGSSNAVPDATSSPATVPGLSAGVTYAITVVATDPPPSDGEPPPSPIMTTTSSSVPVTPTASLVPAVPNNVAAIPGTGDGQATVSWGEATGPNYGTASSYTVTASPRGNQCTTTGLTCTVSGLVDGNYIFTVVATNDVGPTAPSAPSPTVTVSGLTPPGVPTLTGLVSGPNSVTATWEAPADDGGLPITGYTATGDSSNASSSCTVDTLSCTLNNLPVGSTVTVVVGAANAEGGGATSLPMNITVVGGAVEYTSQGSSTYDPTGVNVVSVVAVGGGGGSDSENKSPGGSGGETTASGLLVGTGLNVTVGGGGQGGNDGNYGQNITPMGGSGMAGGSGGSSIQNGGYYSGAGGGDSGVQDAGGSVLVEAGGGGGASTESGQEGGSGGPGQGGGTGGEGGDNDAGGGGTGGTGSAAQPGVQPAGQCIGGGAGSSGSDAGTGTSGLAGSGGVGGAGFSGGHSGGGGGQGCGGGGGGGDDGGGGAGGNYGPSDSFGTGSNGGSGGGDGVTGLVTVTSLAPAQNLAVVGSGSASDPITVSWADPTQPADAAAVGYQVYATAPDGTSSAVANATSSPAIISSLSAGVTYAITVVATDPAPSGGEPPTSPGMETTSSSVPVTPSASLVPAVPTDVTATPVAPGTGNATVTWDEATGPNFGTTSLYTVTASPGGYYCVSPTTTCSDFDLPIGNYTFTVVAANEVGPSYMSAASASIEVLGGPPSEPLGVTVQASPTSGLTSEATISWSAPSNDGDSPITGYTATASPGGASCSTTGALTCNIAASALSAGQNYTFAVTATNVVGTGLSSGPSNAVQILGVPFAPTITSVTGGSNSVIVGWTAPADGGSPITGYTVAASWAVSSSHCSTTTLSCAVAVNPGEPYTFSVVATNALGTGPASASMPGTAAGGTASFDDAGFTLYNLPTGADNAWVTAEGGGGGASNEAPGGAGGEVSTIVTAPSPTEQYGVSVGGGGTGANGGGTTGGAGIFGASGGRARNSITGYQSGAGGGDSGLTAYGSVLVDAGGGGGGSTEDNVQGGSGGPGQGGGQGGDHDNDGGGGGSGGTGSGDAQGVQPAQPGGGLACVGGGQGSSSSGSANGTSGLAESGGEGGSGPSNAGGGGGAGCGGGGGGGAEGGGGAGGSYGTTDSVFSTGDNGTGGDNGNNGGEGFVTLTTLLPAQSVDAQPFDAWATVSWIEPAQPPSVGAVTYQLYQSSNGSQPTPVPGATSSPFTVYDLTPGTAYTYTVVATASVSAGTLSSTSAPASATPTGVVHITPSSLLAGTVGTPYSVTLTVSGGSLPYGQLEVTSGSLPAGLQLLAEPGADEIPIYGTPTQPGTSTVTFTDHDNYNTVGQLSAAITVDALSGSAQPSTTTFGQSITYSATVETGGGDPTGTVAFASGATALCTAPVVNGTASCAVTTTPVGAGETVTAGYSGDATYAATATPIAVTVAQGTQTIAFTSHRPTAAIAGGTYTPTAAATSGLNVALSIDPSDSSVCSISAGMVTFATSGTCTVDANQPGNGQWAPAPQVAQAFLVGGQAQSVTFTSAEPSSAAVGGTAYLPVAGASSGLPVYFSIDPSSDGACVLNLDGSSPFVTSISFLTSGTCIVDADQDGNDVFDPAPQVDQSFPVAPGDQTVSFTSSPPSAAVVNGDGYTPTASASSGLPASFSIDPASNGVCALVGPQVIFNASGTCTVDASQAGDGNWHPAVPTIQAFQVNGEAQSITFTSTPPTIASVGGTYSPTATATSSLAVDLSIDPSATSVCTINAGAVSFASPGSCTIDANQAGSTQWAPAAPIVQSFSVGAAATTTTLAPLPAELMVGTTTNFTATVTAGAGPVPAGSVNVSSGASSLCTITLAAGSGSCSAPIGVAGEAVVVTASYSGSPDEASSSTSATLSVAPAPTPPPAGATSSTSATSFSATGQLQASLSGMTVSGVGFGTVNLATYSADPTPGAVSLGSGLFNDVDVSPGSELSLLTVTICGPGAGNALEWWNGTAWASFSQQTFDTAISCVRATVTPSTSPSLAEFTGTPIASTTTPDGRGYWEVASDGGIFAFGDATFEGSMGGQPLNAPIVGIATTPDGRGYWEVASDGGIFAFGDATFEGSMGGQPLNAPIVGIATTPDGRGYWEVASDGGIFAFGDATFEGSMGGIPLDKPVIGVALAGSATG
jgi:hypothetical protein